MSCGFWNMLLYLFWKEEHCLFWLLSWSHRSPVRLQREPRLLDSGSVSSRQGPVARKAPPASILGHLFSLISNHTLPVHYAPIRPFCSSDPQSLFLPPGSLCLPSLHLVAHSSHRSMHLQLLLFILMWAQKRLLQGPSLTSSSPPPQGKHYLYLSSLCHSPLPESFLFIYLFTCLGYPLSNVNSRDFICFSTSDSQGFSQSLAHWRNAIHVYWINEFENNIADFVVLLSGILDLQKHLRIFSLHFRARVCKLWPMGQTWLTTCFYE